ncbi:nucleotidyltransferase domain-containing protein [Archangium lansingense]|uniref:Cyclic GMP-AMP synthase n=1 Tax=Archangium lansingense TaxID=2995310 RepID=A0ABT4A833_9BACT|nr:nucleotidyltransferase [Archangium lansinium]MCY1077818.1 nucleotidyltransferase [Archangium lansinium]
MANIQKQFVQFDETIRLKRFGENKMLREKRDAILDRLRAQKQIPSFDHINQGSYEMGTGIQPAEGNEYDIDVGLRFNRAKSEYPNPVDLKVLVEDALKNHTDLGARIRRSCVTVYYKLGGEQGYHVDLAIYTYDNPQSSSRRLFLAKGLRDADEQKRWWEESDPQGLGDWVEKRFSDGDKQEQFLRIIRALKRWKTEKFKTDGNNAPSGIGLTVAAGQWFQPQVTHDTFAHTTHCDDLKAMRLFVDVLLTRFTQVDWKQDGSPLYRLTVPVPVAPHKDIFEKMTTGQLTTFRERLVQLQEGLDKAAREPDPVVACELMSKHFGDKFPVPDKTHTGQRGGPAIATSGVSA